MPTRFSPFDFGGLAVEAKRTFIINREKLTMTQQAHALETTRERASQAMEWAGKDLRDLREGLKDAGADAQRQLGRYAKWTSRYASKRPVTSALFVVAVAAVTALSLALLRNKRRHS